eukprot:1414300-Amphidinium_carterae.1
MFELVEQHSKDMQQHGAELADLCARATKLEGSKVLSNHAGAQPVFAPPPPPPCPVACASIFAQQSAPQQSSAFAVTAQGYIPVRFVHYKFTPPNSTAPAAERSPTLGLSREKGDRCVLHVTGFAPPLSYKEMVAFAKDKLALPTTGKVLTRGYF